MQYLLMAYVDETGWPKMSKSEQEQGIAAYAAYGEALKTSGVMKGSNRLQPSSVATTCGVATASRKCWMALMSIRRSSWAATF